MVIKFAGSVNSEVVVVLDPANEIFPDKAVSTLLQECLRDSGIDNKNVAVIRCSPAVPEELKEDKTAAKNYILQYRDTFFKQLNRYVNAKVVIVCGSQALTQYTGKKSLKVSDYYGFIKHVEGRYIIGTSSADFAVVRLDPIPVFKAEFRALAKFKAANYQYSDKLMVANSENYEWRVDISDILANKPTSIAFDTETTGLDWKLDSVYPIVAQMTFKEGHSILTPLSYKYFPEYFEEKFGKWNLKKLIGQWKELLEDPNVKVIGHNIKFDMHMISKVGIEINNVFLDTMQMLHAIDENSIRRNLDIAVKQYVPSMFGYADCVSPDSLVLTADMRKVMAAALKPGDVLCAFTEDITGGRATRRRMSRSIVLNTQSIRRNRLSITTKSGRNTIVSDGHLMLIKRLKNRSHKWEWARADSLIIGDNLKPFPFEDQDISYEAGYIAGLLDGEGWMCPRQAKVGVSQTEGTVLDTFTEYIDSFGLQIGCKSYDKRKEKRIANFTLHGAECFKVLQKFRPKRLMEQFKWEGCGLPTTGFPYDPIVSIENLGEGEVIGLETSTQTIIADGLLSHNSFNENTDKGNMLEVHPDDMVSYAGGDTDATFRLAKALYKILNQDKANLGVLMKVRMPAIKSFYKLEKTGIRIDLEALPTLVNAVTLDIEDRHKELIMAIPKKVLRKHAWDSGKGDSLKPSSRALMTDAFFSADGCGLTPKVFTAKKVPTLSVSKHLVYFEDDGIELLALFAEYQKLSKLANTYIGSDEDPEKLKGLYKYIHFNPNTKEYRVHSSFNIDTVTSRSSSKKPNVQNLPQGRGDKDSRAAQTAKAYKKLFIPREGYSLVEIDYSQAEVRLAACKSKDQAMIDIYAHGLDVYRATAATVMMGITLEDFLQLPEEVQKAKRQASKAVVLGFMYGLMAKSFKTYAKILFGVEFTDQESEKIRDTFFSKHRGFATWHEQTKLEVKTNKQVRSLFGAVRHLPSIDSKDAWIVREAEREAINSPIQGDSSNMGLIALDLIYKDFDMNIIRPINFVHDALYFEVKTEYVEEYAPYLRWYMENIPLKEMFGLDLGIPLIAEVEIGTSFANKEKFDCEAVRPLFCSLIKNN